MSTPGRPPRRQVKREKPPDHRAATWRVERGNEPNALDARTLAELDGRLELFRFARANRRREPVVAAGRAAATFEQLRAEVEKGRADLARHAGRPTPPPLGAEELDRLRWLHDAMRDARTRPDDSVPGGRRIPDEIALDVLDPLERAITLLAAMPEAREALEHVAAAVHRLVGHSNLLGRGELEELSTARSDEERALRFGRALMSLGVGSQLAKRILRRDCGISASAFDRGTRDG